MPSDVETNIRSALEKLTKALADASALTVRTSYKVVTTASPTDLSDATLAAQTTIQLDGDHDAIVPVTTTETGGIAFQDALLEFHLRNVQAALTYRTNVLNTLVDLVRRRGL
jgi:5,10-methylenetetrahydrofolate reductase